MNILLLMQPSIADVLKFTMYQHQEQQNNLNLCEKKKSIYNSSNFM